MPVSDARGAALRDCLYVLNASTILDLLPATWEVGMEGAIPPSTAGWGFAGLAVVDGVTVSKPVLEGLREPVMDVPLILSALGQEMDFSPNATVEGMNHTSFRQLLRHGFQPWGSNVGETLGFLYGAELNVSAQKAFTSIASDMCVNCGLAEVAQAAAAGFKQPIYLIHGQIDPATAVGYNWNFEDIFSGIHLHYAFHLSDLVLGARMFDFFDYILPWFAYEPSDDDLAAAQAVSDMWLSLVHDPTGKQPHLIDIRDCGQAIAKREGGATVSNSCSYVTNVMGYKGISKPSINERAEQCDFLKSIGIDQRFWWTN